MKKTNDLTLTYFWAGSNSAHVARLNPTGLAESIAQANDPTGQTRGTREFPHACMPSYCSSELQFNWIVQNTNMNACIKIRRTNLEAENEKDDDDVEGVLASLSMLSYVLALSPLFSIVVRLLSFISASSSLSLSTGFSSFVPPYSADLVCRKWSKDQKAIPACSSFWWSFFFIVPF